MKQLFAGKRIVIMGLGLNGGGLLSAQFCLAHGAEVLVTDINPADKLQTSVKALQDFAAERLSVSRLAVSELRSGEARAGHSFERHCSRLEFRLGRHEREDFRQADWVIKNPGVPSQSPYLESAKSWTTDLALFLELFPQVPVIAVTGTKGKSSIAYALHYLLQFYYPKAMLGGNIGRSPLACALDEISGEGSVDLSGASPLVLELSSWQLGDLRKVEKHTGNRVFHPRLACLSNIMNDHQNRYHRFYDYVADKFYIFQSMAQNDCGELLLATAEAHAMYLGSQAWGDFATRSFAACKPLAASKRLHYFCSGAMETGLRGIRWQAQDSSGSRTCFIHEASNSEDKASRVFLCRKEFALLGQHSFQNYCISSYLAYRFLQMEAAVGTESFVQRNQQEFLPQYAGVPFRMELRGSHCFNAQSVLHFINDTTATMPDASAAALTACLESIQSKQKGHCLLIAGGTDKNLDPSTLLSTLRQYQGRVSLFLLQGNGSEALIPMLQNLKLADVGGHTALRENCTETFVSLDAAFAAACAEACEKMAVRPQQYLILSPGYASFGMFHNEFDRGRRFNDLVDQYLANAQSPT